MKKFSKNIMKVVAILLILVLMTSCIISSTLAAFVVTKDASTTVGFSAFGVTVNLDAPSIGVTGTAYTGESATLTLNNVTLKPDDAVKAITASISGTPTVASTVTIDVDITYDETKFTVPKTLFSNLGSNTQIFVPAGFKVGSAGDYTVTPYNSNDDATTEQAIEEAIAGKSNKLNYSTQNKNVSGSFAAGETISGLENINVSFSWPKTYNAVSNSNEIGTYIARTGNTPSFTISYTITVQQN
ncbi:MAG: hypothetical protein E7678_02540 [Ruminococcaceae bacterium]|nr:hypothetical protein [Oscillospiraceae bacterium]